ncbi:MAG: hypothetical protein RRZ33_00345 [Lachnospiraceae bacterium]
MGELILCSSQEAKNPYCPDNSNIEFYSLEEFCYFYLKNPRLIDMSLMNLEFCNWVERELKLTALAETLHKMCTEKGKLGFFMKEIIEATSYLSLEEEEELLFDLSQIEVDHEVIRRKKLGDKYFLSERFKRAITEYRKLLLLPEIQQESKELIGNIWHNLGCAYGRQFLYEEARVCFLNAMSLNHNVHSQEMIERLKNREENMEELIGDEANRSVIEKELQEIKENYRRNQR